MMASIEPDLWSTDSPAEPRGEAEGGQLDSIGGEEDSHAGPNDTGLDGLDGLHIPDQLLLVHAHTGTPHCTQYVVFAHRMLCSPAEIMGSKEHSKKT